MSRKFTAIVAGIGIAALAVAAIAAIQIGTSDATAQGGPANRGGGVEAAALHVEPDTAAPLTAGEAADLAYMREEEKLAHDVYTVLGDEYGARFFMNISASEAQHTETVKEFLDAFGADDPASGLAAGRFENDELQALYDQLIAQGKESFEEAVRVGIAIEERDIADLKDRIAATDRADLKAMYENLLAGSENHLAAFTRQLDGPAGGGLGQGGGNGQGGGYGGGQGGGYGGGQGDSTY